MSSASIAFMAILCAALASSVFADNDEGQSETEADPRRRTMLYPQIVIVDRDRDIVRTYYRAEHAAGRCPPGLVMKKNGCLPPGQVDRMWALGQPLPTEIVYAQVPREIWRQLTPAPYGHEYVRVADDVVLISTMTLVIVALLGNLQNVGD